MPTGTTPLLGLALPVTGDLTGTWGTTVNDSITSLVDSAIAGTTTLSSDTDVTLTTATLAANEARQAIIVCSGARTAVRNITAPASSKVYVVTNSTTGNFAVNVRGVGPTTGVNVYAGETATVIWNGSDFVKLNNYILQPYASAVARSNQLKQQDIVSLKDFIANGTTNYTSAVQAFVTAVTTNGLIGLIPSGTYTITSTVTITVGTNDFSIIGSNGAVFSTAGWGGGSTPAIKLVGSGNSVDWLISGFDIKNDASSAATVGLQIGDATVASIGLLGYNFSRIENVHIQGFVTRNWSIAHTRMIELRNCSGWYTTGTSKTNLYITQNGSATSDLRFYNCQFVNIAGASNYNVEIVSTSGPYNPSNGNNSIAGMKFIGCDFYNGQRGVSINASAGSLVSNFWFEGGCQFDQETTNAIYVASSGSGTIVEDFHFADVYVDKSTGDQITFTTSTSGTIKSIWVTQCSIWRGLGSAIATTSGCTAVHIIDNEIIDNAGTNAISIDASTGVKIRGNRSRQGALSAQPTYLIKLFSGTTDIEVTGNSGQFTTGLIDELSGNVTSKVINNNPGYNPRPQASITVTASPFTYTNWSGAPQLVSIGSGTISAITVDGLAITPTTNLFMTVPHSKALTITYSAAPTLFSLGV